MRSPPALFRFIARAALNIVGGGLLGDFAVEVLPDMAKDVWKWWGGNRPEEQLRAELQAVAQLSPAETKGYAESAAQEELAGHPETVRQAVANYVTLVPNAIRQSQRRPGDPSGLSLASGFALRRPEDLLRFLPSRMPRFRSGDRPPGIGDWELQELLGIGGFGEVWKAGNPHLLHAVAALKFCTDATAAKMLRNEAALLGRVMSEGKHRGIVKLLHTYLNTDTPCLEYEYVAGGDLSKVIAQWHRSPSASTAEKASKLVYNLAEIVAYAHGLNPPIVHRDLKPANILLHRINKGAYALRVTDFGIGGVVAEQALAADKRGSSRGASLATALRGAHTPLYASPQQIRGEPPDPRDDVHAIGVIWYQLLTGDMIILSLPADWQDEVRSRGLGEDSLALLSSCLATRLEKRPVDAGELARRIDEIDAAELARRISEIQAAPSLQLSLPPPTDSANRLHQPSNSQVDQASPSSPVLPDATANEWHYTLKGQPIAVPVSAAQLKQLATSGRLKPTDLVWQDGMLEWAPANSVVGLFPTTFDCPTCHSPVYVAASQIGHMVACPKCGTTFAALGEETDSTTNPVDAPWNSADSWVKITALVFSRTWRAWFGDTSGDSWVKIAVLVFWQTPLMLLLFTPAALLYAAIRCLLPPTHPWRVRYPTLESWWDRYLWIRWTGLVFVWLVMGGGSVFLATVVGKQNRQSGAIIGYGIAVVSWAWLIINIILSPSGERKWPILWLVVAVVTGFVGFLLGSYRVFG